MPEGFEGILMATHYTCLMERCRDKGGKDCLELASKVSITLLRYSDFIPCDKCFYQARLSTCLQFFHICCRLCEGFVRVLFRPSSSASRMLTPHYQSRSHRLGAFEQALTI